MQKPLLEIGQSAALGLVHATLVHVSGATVECPSSIHFEKNPRSEKEERTVLVIA